MEMLGLAAVILCWMAGGAAVEAAPPSAKTIGDIATKNALGPYIGVVVPNAYEMNPLITSSAYSADPLIPTIDYGGRRFRFGMVANKNVIIVMTGLSMLNAGITTQLLLTLFNVEGIVHFGIAGNANPNLQIGDVAVPNYWGHTGLWNWQRYGDGPNDTLAFEWSGDYTRMYGYLNFASFNNVTGVGNYLNNVWYQPEEIFPVAGVPEQRQHAFWVQTDKRYYSLAANLQNVTLKMCVNATTCLPRQPMVAMVDKGCSAAVFVDNAAYRSFLSVVFNVTAIDMETAAVALVSLEQGVPFIALRALSDLAGGGSSLSNEAATFSDLAADNAVTATIAFISML